ncbi:MAG: hypothetical protein L3J39_09750 [Verrucomicrobiales bacterium]|nr:hypothetical protein [Verrucomicrobiales bacterium]
MKKLALLLGLIGGLSGWTLTVQAAEPALFLKKPRMVIANQLTEYVQFYLNPNPVKKGSKVHEIYIYVGQTELTGSVAITIQDDGGVLFSTNDLMEGSYRTLGMAIVRIELDRKLSTNFDSVKLKSVRAKSRLVVNPTERSFK